MIISPGRGYIFVHIPKTGGTSLALALEDRAMKDDILIGDTPKARRRRGRMAALTPRGRLWKHARLADIDGILAPDQIDRMTVVTIARNPWDRMVSYYHWLRAQRFNHPAVARAGRMSFAEFLRDPATRAEMSRDQLHDYLRMADGRSAPALVLRFDRLADDIALLEDRIGTRLTLGHANPSARPQGYAKLYDDETAGIVAAAYRDDIKRMAFTFS
ncbi:sulfotransferase family 2 domain-containing protein [Palleronia abyssalis]|uniref:Sulfotransferase family protein n=1 Tax=Palleronia abyssalis TaxID=1501240 RepID=A0A2R8BXC9_9RHOB|nr:sulfotransferase family 2 domain-containing protein [Palleronia abyssalis]SPJ24726.1 hypothetical protein PAA8504_02564 [Palleronia abyssalis]